jgi:hypothetical protein
VISCPSILNNRLGRAGQRSPILDRFGVAADPRPRCRRPIMPHRIPRRWAPRWGDPSDMLLAGNSVQIKGNSVVIKNNGMVIAGAGDNCCCSTGSGSGSGSGSGLPCCLNARSLLTAAVSGITPCAEGQLLSGEGGLPYLPISPTQNWAGTYCAPDTFSSSTECVWQTTISSGFSLQFVPQGTVGSCTPVTGTADVVLNVIYSSGSWSAKITSNFVVGGSGIEVSWFEGTASDNGFCTESGGPSSLTMSSAFTNCFNAGSNFYCTSYDVYVVNFPYEREYPVAATEGDITLSWGCF